MVRVEFIEKVRFLTSEKFEVLASTSIPAVHLNMIVDYVNSLNPTDSARDHILDNIASLKVGQGFSVASKKCKYIRVTDGIK